MKNFTIKGSHSQLPNKPIAFWKGILIFRLLESIISKLFVLIQKLLQAGGIKFYFKKEVRHESEGNIKLKITEFKLDFNVQDPKDKFN